MTVSAETRADDPRAAAEPVMAELDQWLDAMAPVIGRDRPVVLADYPLHLNIGDLVLSAGTDAWLERAGIPVAGRFTPGNFGTGARRAIAEGATILFGGGGNLGDIWPDFHRFHERVIEACPDSRIVFLPQTARFRKRETLDRSRRIFDAHRDLHLFVRDRESLELCRSAFAAPATLVPDMAHALRTAPRMVELAERPGHGTLTLARTDHESRGAGTAPDGAVDWRDLLTDGDRRRYHGFRVWHALDRRTGNRLDPEPVWRRFRDRLVDRMIATFADHETIHTDRLHGLIIGALIDRRVIFSDTADGKLSGYHGQWLSAIASIGRETPA
ncbi:MAG: polysaccharide pyruvyl transferase family protein [Azospirillaceae bacterium]